MTLCRGLDGAGYPRPSAALVTAAALSSSVPAAVADGAGTAPSSDTTRAADGKPTVVLVHGAFADSSSWNGGVGRLQTDGYRVIAAANPLRGLPTGSAYIASVLRSVQGPIVLVGHSYGGAPDLERFQAKRAGSHTVEIDASHVVMISHPDAIADLIRNAARTQSSTPALAATGLSTLGLVGAAAAGGMLIAGGGLIAVGRKRSTGTR